MPNRTQRLRMRLPKWWFLTTFALALNGDDSLRLRDGATTADFVIATDEVHLAGKGLDRVLKLDARRRASHAIPQDAKLQVVLYPSTGPRTPDRRRILTRRVSAELREGSDAAALSEAVGAARFERLSFAPRRVVFHAKESSGLALADRLRGQDAVVRADVILDRLLHRRAVPNDPLFPQQWTLRNTGQSGGTAGADANLLPAWDSGRDGTGVTLSVVDDGVETTHPDLADRIVPNSGFDYRDNDASPEPEGDAGPNDEGNPKADSHGTAVAGVAAATGNNGVGVAGAAYRARLVPIRLIGGNAGDDQEAQALGHRLDIVHVSNNSWGAADDGKTVNAPGPLAEAAIDAGLRQGRGGRGTIYVWSAGNGGNASDNANNDGYANAPGTIAVGALNDLGRRADYSEPGACLVVSAPSGNDGARSPGSLTTDLLGDRGYNRADVATDLTDVDYTSTFNGTSSAAPLVSGVIALMLQANPELGWRDVQEILIRSAAKTDPANPGWFTNAAGLRFNHEFGAGRIDAGEAVRMSVGWPRLGARISASAAKLTEDLVPIPSGGVLEQTLPITQDLRVEHATLQVELSHPSRGELAIELVSPSGTVSRLFEPHADPTADLSHRFGSTFQWGENARGVWRLRIRGTGAADGTLRTCRLETFGTAIASQPTTVRIAALGQAAEGFRIRVEGAAGQRAKLQRSSDLGTWTDVVTQVLSTGSTELLDTAPVSGARFYRVVPGTP